MRDCTAHSLRSTDTLRGMESLPPGYLIKEGCGEVDFGAVHRMLVHAYWCRGTTQDRVVKAARGSTLVIGVFHEGEQVAYARVVSDRTTFGWICDVIVREDHRGKGLGRAMVRFAIGHPEHQRFRRWVLATQDAQGVYGQCGFEPIDRPENWMAFRPPDAPERASGQPDVV
jgi:GNAT superfamily N-acetyltransferase